MGFLYIVPYDEVSSESALVEMFGQVGAKRCQYVVAIGALAGLTVSMFGGCIFKEQKFYILIM